MKKIFKVIKVVLIYVFVSYFIILIVSKPNSYNTVRLFLLTNKTELKKLAEDFYNEGEFSKEYEIKKKIKGIDIVGNGVMLETSSSGFGPATSYKGLLYSMDDKPYCFETKPEKKGKNTYYYQGDGDNHCVVKKISKNWYYYEMYF